MDADRLTTGELIAAGSAAALLIIMFLPWFGIPFATFNAWESFDFLDLVLLVTILVAIGLAVATAVAQTVAVPVVASAITAGLGIISTVLILYRVIDPVGAADVSREYGLFLGLIAAAGIAYGGWRAMEEEESSGRGGPAA
jgi:hypothetical protein